MTRIKESKNISFGNKILKLEDVYDIAQILSNEHTKAKASDCSITFTVICENGPSYESSDINLFSPKSIINSKKPINIQLWFTNYNSDDRIRIKFRAEYNSEYSENSVIVEGYDSNWVNGVLGRISERIESIELQNPNRNLFLNLILFASATLIGRIFIFLIDFFPSEPIDESKLNSTLLLIRHLIRTNAFTYNFTLYLLGFCFGIFPAFYIRNYFRKLWPYLEFQIGPNHEQDESRKRAKLRKLITIIIIPLILMILYDVVKQL